MISRIEVFGYRCFRELSVDLGPYHVLAGANGAGKSTLLDVPVLLGDMLGDRRVADVFLRRSESRTTPRAHTLSELPFQGRGGTLFFAVEARLPDEVVESIASRALAPERWMPSHLRYELLLKISTYELTVAEEYLFLYSEKGNRPIPGEREPQGRPAGSGDERLVRLRHNDWLSLLSRRGSGVTRFTSETSAMGAGSSSIIPQFRVPADLVALGAVLPDPALFPAALWFAQLLRDGVVYFDPDWTLLRQAAPPGDPPTLLPSGRNTPWLALALQAEDPDRFSSWVDHVRTALPQVRTIAAAERDSDHHAYLEIEYTGGHRVASAGLSDGTLRILTLTLLPYLDPAVPPRLLVTEEPENGIHPRAIETVVQSLRSLYESQVWVSTHSPVVLAHTDLADVLASRLEVDGAVAVVRGDEHPRLKHWQGSLDIGTLFAAGVLS